MTERTPEQTSGGAAGGEERPLRSARPSLPLTRGHRPWIVLSRHLGEILRVGDALVRIVPRCPARGFRVEINAPRGVPVDRYEICSPEVKAQIDEILAEAVRRDRS